MSWLLVKAYYKMDDKRTSLFNFFYVTFICRHGCIACVALNQLLTKKKTITNIISAFELYPFGRGLRSRTMGCLFNSSDRNSMGLLTELWRVPWSQFTMEAFIVLTSRILKIVMLRSFSKKPFFTNRHLIINR